MTQANANSHTHCQVAPADTQAKTWQRVWLFQRTTDRQTNEKTSRAACNIGFARERVNGFDWTFVQGSTFVLRLNFSAKNPLPRKAENRYRSCYCDSADNKRKC